ncbi:MAG TPA: histone [archaeon]|nr:histone [archaeon]
MFMEFTIQPLRKLLKKTGAKRISDGAAEELGKTLEEKTKMLAIEAKRIAEHSGRRTILKRDVKLAKKALED